MHRNEYPYAGLILPDAADLDPAPYLETAAAVLARLDPSAGATPRRGKCSVMGRALGVQIIPQEDSDYGPRMLIEIITFDGALPDAEQDEEAAQLLSDVVLQAFEHSSADILEWYSPDVLLDREDFIRLRSYVSPRRLPANVPTPPAPAADTATPLSVVPSEAASDTIELDIRARLYPDLDETEETLALESDDVVDRESTHPKATDWLAKYQIKQAAQEPKKSRFSAASWLLTGALAIFNLPIALFVGVVHGGRGTDFRLVSQALAVTGLFAILYHTDRLGQVVRAFFQ